MFCTKWISSFFLSSSLETGTEVRFLKMSPLFFIFQFNLSHQTISLTSSYTSPVLWMQTAFSDILP